MGWRICHSSGGKGQDLKRILKQSRCRFISTDMCPFYIGEFFFPSNGQDDVDMGFGDGDVLQVGRTQGFEKLKALKDNLKHGLERYELHLDDNHLAVWEESVSEFAQVRGKKGFCSHCLKLALLIEDEMDVDSDGGKVDFKDRETYEFLFMEYYEIIKDKEGITAENVHSADALLKKGKNYGSSSDSDELYKGHEEDQLELSDCDDMDDSEGHKRVVRRKSSVKGKATPLKREFIGWGSKVLIEFLASIGQDTTQKLSQYDVTSIIRHLAENLEESEDDEARYSSEDKDETVLMACKRQRKSNLETPQIKELTPLIPQSRFAAIVPKNIKLIYLKRSLMLELLKQPDTFESKVKGSFGK
ncbi:Uncharacterized protein CK203_070953 [Vitis vinifera]|uniref:Plus3 domain-containing protein n=1 Tax=Vitis vinifera TaxID=29760 RepID=A0A438E9E1_VITVI|nr:Uncharacterized protein CK203_070953 [Vitis vinifera]